MQPKLSLMQIKQGYNYRNCKSIFTVTGNQSFPALGSPRILTGIIKQLRFTLWFMESDLGRRTSQQG